MSGFLLIVIIGLILIIGYGTGSSKITTTNISPRKDRLQTIKEKGVLTFVSANEPLFAYINLETNKLSGIHADIITEIAKRLGISKVELN